MQEAKNIDWDSIREKLPYERTDEQKEKRKQLFKEIDVSNNGYLSLSEVDKGLRDVLKVDEIFDVKPVIQKAFNAAKNATTSKSSHGQNYVELSEFRLML